MCIIECFIGLFSEYLGDKRYAASLHNDTNESQGH